MRTRVVTATVIAVLVGQPLASNAETASYRIDPAKSSVTIHVGKSGAFSFVAGHTHEVSGPIQSGSVDVDQEEPSRSHVRLVIGSANLTVSAAGEPAGDAPKVQETMQGEQVLDVRRFPQITYESTAIVLKSRRENVLELTITGQLTIRDITRPVTVPVHVELGAEGLSANGRFEIKQTAFGIKPISVGGVVSVKDTLDLQFAIAATP